MNEQNILSSPMLCDGCWERYNPDEAPVRIFLLDGRMYRCSNCGHPSDSGIFQALNPDPVTQEDDDEQPEDAAESLPGLCCACGAAGPHSTIIMLPHKAPVAGTGWGCFVCGLPPDGALAVVCDACAGGNAMEKTIRQACRGYPMGGERVEIAYLTEPFDHDLSKHLNEEDV